MLAGLALLRPAIPESASSFGYVVAFVAAQGLAIALGLVALRRQVRAWQLTLRLGALARSLTALRGGSVEAALRRALHDPGLTLSYWSADLGGYVDRDGRPVERLRTDPFVQSRAGRRTTSVTRRDRPVALLVHGPKVDGQRVARALGAGVRLALENEQLRAAATATLRDLEESRGRILERAMAERHRLERNLHDGTQQRLVSLALLVRMLRNHVSDQADVAVAVRAEALVLETLEELRRIARGLYPAALADGGLSVALHDLAESSTDVAVQVDRAPQRRYHGTVETTAYLVSAAAISDARARAASRLTIRATESTGRLVLDLEDDAAPDRVNGADACSGLADQVAALAGRIATRRTASGVHVRLEVPCAR